MNSKTKQPKILFWDIETKPLQAWVWSPGKQYVGHKQLVKDNAQFGIICVCYCWNDGKPAKSIDWGYDEQNTGALVEEFDKILKEADWTIGKNSDRFDTKMLNAARMFAGLPGMPDWTKYTDDLEKQMRRHFRLPSQSLDYISGQLGYGGKIKMEFQDWIDICEKNEDGMKKFKKMIKYCKKDVEDTRSLWDKLSEHFEPKLNKSVFISDGARRCRHCGSDDLRKDGIKCQGQSRYQKYACRACHRYAGRCAIRANSEGRIG